jgi:tRNA threonylcarbamoyl adenosine modification protein (Sua5/YciO/YrdC/YwlC family)
LRTDPSDPKDPADPASPADPAQLDLAIRALKDGLVVAVPTDTVYGLAVDPFRAGAVDRLFVLKARPVEVALPVLVATWEQVEAMAGPLPDAARRLAERFWPGPLTLVVPRRIGVDVDLGGLPDRQGTVGIRWPLHPVMAALCRAVGPLAVTSANRHGMSPSTSVDEVLAAFATDRPAVVVDGGVCNQTPSTVVEFRGSTPHCLRQGAIPWSVLTDGHRER